MGRQIRRLGSDPNLICPRRLRLSSHRVLVNSNFHPPYGFINTWCFSVTFSANLCLAIWATHTRHTGLIHEFLRFTAKEIVGISEEWLQHHLVNPNSDSAFALNKRFYCSPDPHSAFTCDTKSTTT